MTNLGRRCRHLIRGRRFLHCPPNARRYLVDRNTHLIDHTHHCPHARVQQQYIEKMNNGAEHRHTAMQQESANRMRGQRDERECTNNVTHTKAACRNTHPLHVQRHYEQLHLESRYRQLAGATNPSLCDCSTK